MKLKDFLGLLKGVQKAGDGWLALCPAHNDHQPSLSINQKDGRILIKCFAGCSTEAILESLGLTWRDLFTSERDIERTIGEGCTTATPRHNSNETKELRRCRGVAPPAPPATPPGLTLERLEEVKKLQVDRLREWGCSNQKLGRAQVVRIPYFAPPPDEGVELAIRYRCALRGPNRFKWHKGSRVHLYGLWFLLEFKERGWVLLVEGESDCWTAWTHRIPALGIPGKSTWRSEWAEYLEGFDVLLWKEPDAEDLVLRVGADIPGLKVITAPDGIKDLSEAHMQGKDVPRLLETLKAKAIPAQEIIKAYKDAKIKELKEKAAPILAIQDPLTEVERALRGMGYGGDLRPALITYLAATTRLLKMRPGAMPAHLLLCGQSSSGKSFMKDVVLSLLPDEAYHKIDAGSPRALIYDETDLQYKVVVFGEADSLPAGEDNPAASAVRNLLQDHHLHYDVTVRNKKTGEFKVKKVRRLGPTVLLTTSTRRLGHQLDTRLFTLEVPDGKDQVRAALRAQAKAETGGVDQPSEALLAFQGYLQVLAPWDAYIPFVGVLADLIGKRAMSPRILRDFQKLVALIKSVTILRHAHRERDAEGRIVATLEDYNTVRELAGPMYEATLTGASEAIRELVHTVLQVLHEGCNTTASEIAKRLNINRGTVSRRVHAALRGGWLVNEETRKGYPWKLKEGEPLPEKKGLPTLEEVREACCRCCSVAGVTDGYTTNKLGGSGTQNLEGSDPSPPPPFFDEGEGVFKW